MSTIPDATQCHACGAWGAVVVCGICGEERPAYAMLKKMSAERFKAWQDEIARRLSNAR